MVAFLTAFPPIHMQSGWRESSDGTKDDVQREFQCCGLFSVTDPAPLNPGPNCPGPTLVDKIVCYPILR